MFFSLNVVSGVHTFANETRSFYSDFSMSFVLFLPLSAAADTKHNLRALKLATG